MKFFALTATISALAAVAAASPLAERAGPSGKLSKPSGGETFAKGDSVEFQYQVVNQSDAKTTEVSVNWQSYPDSKLARFKAGGEFSNISDGKIVDTVIAPTDFCGKVYLIVDESQTYQGKDISFRSASPIVNIQC